SLNFDGTTLNTIVADPTDSTLTPAQLALVNQIIAAFPNAPSPSLLNAFAATQGSSSFGRVRPISPNLKNPELRSVNFGIQHEFTRTLSAEIQYLGQFGF